MAEELEGDFAGKPRAAATIGHQGANVAAAATANTGASPSAKTITEAVEEYLHEEGREWKKKTPDETRRALRWLVQVVGDVRPDTVKREDMKRFKANVERVPRGTTATAEIRTFAAKVPERALDRATVTKLLGRVVAFFSWTVDRQWVRTSPAEGLLKNGKKRGREARELRESFTRTELASIFGADYAANEGSRPARFWLPLLALYTGARRGELAQLLVRDVRDEEGVLLLDLNDDGHGKSLKTEASRRKVPVHSQVIELGLAQFVEARRQDGAERLFPDVKQTANGWGDEVGKWFGRWKRKHGITTEKKTLHSTRHTVRDALARGSRRMWKAIEAGRTVTSPPGGTGARRLWTSCARPWRRSTGGSRSQRCSSGSVGEGPCAAIFFRRR
ncbi:MAG: site-specific integrase [Myxococcota bacterium]